MKVIPFVLVTLMLIGSASAIQLMSHKANSDPFSTYKNFTISYINTNGTYQGLINRPINFDGSNVTITICNSLSNTYNVSGNSFKIGPSWKSGKMACNQTLNSLESYFQQLLTPVATFSVRSINNTQTVSLFSKAGRQLMDIISTK